MRLLVLLCLSAVAAAAAPPPEDVRKRVAALEDELQKLRAQLPAAQDALHTLENRLEAVGREVERLGAAREAEPFAKGAIDQLRVEVDALERRLAGTQERVRELQSTEPAVRFGYDEGLYVKTQPVTLNLNAELMPRWVGVLRDGSRGNDSSFELHHGQVQIHAGILGFVDVQLMLDFGAEYLGDGKISILRDAFVDVRPLPWLTLRAGQFKVPFSHQRLVSSFRQTFAERTLATRAFTFDRDLGGELELRLAGDRLLLQVALTDGVSAGAAARNDNLDFAYTVRVLGQPLGAVPLAEGDVTRTPAPRFSIGAAFQYDLQPNALKVDLNRDGAVDNVAVYSLDVEAALKWRGFALEAEYFFRREESGAGLSSKNYQGAYGQLSMMVWRGFQLGARFSWAQPHTLASSKLGLFGNQPRDGLEAGGVVNYWIWRERVRAQVAYDFRRDQAAGSGAVEQGHVVQAQLQAGF